MSYYLEHHSDMFDSTERAGGNLDGVPASIVPTPGMRPLRLLSTELTQGQQDGHHRQIRES